MPTKSVLGVLLCLASAGWSEMDLPEGIEFEPYDIPELDSLLVRTMVTRPYDPASQQDVVLFQLLQSKYGSNVIGLAEDNASIRIAASNGYTTMTDSAGLELEFFSRNDLFSGGSIVNTARRSYGADGRLAREIQVLVDENGNVEADTTRYVWNHPACADDQDGTRRRQWKLDIAGRCVEADVRYRSENGVWGVVSERHLVVWDGDRIERGLVIDMAGDTSARDEYSYGPDGRLLSVACSTKTDGVWRMETSREYEWNGDVFARILMIQSDESTGGSVETIIENPKSRMGVARDARKLSGLEVRTGDRSMVFANSSKETIEVTMTNPEGRIIGFLALQPASVARWVAPGSTSVVGWVAKSPSGVSSGRSLIAR